MKFIFEDNENDLISQFLISMCPEQASNFIFACGNTYEADIVTDLLNDSAESIICFLDTIPGNSCILRIYNDLLRLSKSSNRKMIVLPIVCMEYYVIKFLAGSQTVLSTDDLNICLEKDFYLNSPLLVSDADVQFCKNFEKYCKLVLIKSFKDCARHSGKQTNSLYGKYYFENCRCSLSSSNCLSEILNLKYNRFWEQFPCILNDPHLDLDTSYDYFLHLHRSLVCAYNEMVDHYKAVDTRQFVKYNHIRSL